MELLVTKIVVLLLLGVIKLGFGLLPILLSKWLKDIKGSKTLDKFLGIVLCLGGGVLLATVFVHMIPEVREGLSTAQSSGYLPEDSEYPLAELLICLGFFMIYGVESFVHKIFKAHGHHGHSHNYLHNGQGSSNSISTATTATVVSTTSEHHEMQNNLEGVENGAFDDGEIEQKTINAARSDEHPDSLPYSSNNSFNPSKKVSLNGDNVYNVSTATLTRYSSQSDSIDTSLPPHVARPGSNTKLKAKKSVTSMAKEKNILVSVRNFLMILAISLHSVFEGMAVGLQLDTSDVWKLFVAIGIHSVAIAFCIGVDMISTNTRKRHIFFYMTVLAMVASTGVVIGIIVTEHVNESNGVQHLVISILQGLAGGTLLYITFYEVMDRDKLIRTKMTGLTGLFFLFAGFAFMAGLETIGGHSHGHGGHDHSHGSHALGSVLNEHIEHEHHEHGHNTNYDKMNAITHEVRKAIEQKGRQFRGDHNHEEHVDDHENHGSDEVHKHEDHDQHDHKVHEEHDHDTGDGHNHGEHDHENQSSNDEHDHDEHNRHEHEVYADHDEHVNIEGGDGHHDDHDKYDELQYDDLLEHPHSHSHEHENQSGQEAHDKPNEKEERHNDHDH